MLGLGLALALPQYKEKQQEKGLHYELQKGSNSYNEGPSQDNNVKTLPSFDAVKEEAEDTKEPEEDDQESKKCTPIDTACCLDEGAMKFKGESAAAIKKKREECKKEGKYDCCEGSFCSHE